MAFNLLSSEELSVLDDNQRKQYERELDLYQQRIAFVEHIEILENAHIEPYKPKLESITIVSAPEARTIKRNKYVVRLDNSVEKPEIDIKQIKKIEQVTPILPLIQTHTGIQTKHIKEIEKKDLDFPKFVEPQITAVTFKWSEQETPKLPTVIYPSERKNINLEQLKNNLMYTPSNIPDIVLPDKDIKPITIYRKPKPSLPKVPSCIIEEINYTKPKKSNVELPTIDIPAVNSDYCSELQPIHPILPEVPTCGIEKINYINPEKSNVELPAIDMPTINNCYYNAMQPVQPILPEVLAQLDLCRVEFHIPEPVLTKLPNVGEVSIETRTFDKPENIQANLVVPPIPSVTIKTFVMPQRDIPNLPEINIKEVPNAYARLEELFFSTE